MAFGCKYNKKFQICQKSPNPDDYDPNCEMYENRCVIKHHKDKPGILTRPPQTMLNWKISGPVSAHSLTYNGKKYYFFGDIHRSTEGECKVCSNYVFNVPDSRCSTMAKFIVDTITRADKLGEYVDVYIEFPYLTTYKLERFIPKYSDMLPELSHIFWPCFIKKDCPYYNARFHYIDIRQILYSPSSDRVSTYFGSIFTSHISDDLVRLSDILKKNINLFQDIKRNISGVSSQVEKWSKFNNIIKDFDELMTALFQPRFTTEFGNIYLMCIKLALESDDYIEDIKRLIGNVEKGSTIHEYLKGPLLVVNRDGKTMFRARAQLYELEREGQKILAAKIKHYILSRISSEEFTNSEIYDKWTQIMQYYHDSILKTNSSETGVYPQLIKPLINDIITYMLTINAYVIDAYILGRMFRKFSQSRKLIPHVESNKIIVCAGLAHINLYIDFFQNILGSTGYSYGLSDFDDVYSPETYNRCIDVDIRDFT